MRRTQASGGSNSTTEGSGLLFCAGVVLVFRLMLFVASVEDDLLAVVVGVGVEHAAAFVDALGEESAVLPSTPTLSCEPSLATVSMDDASAVILSILYSSNLQALSLEINCTGSFEQRTENGKCESVQ